MAQNGGTGSTRRFPDLAAATTTTPVARVHHFQHHHHLNHHPVSGSPLHLATLAQQQPLLPLPVHGSAASRGVGTAPSSSSGSISGSVSGLLSVGGGGGNNSPASTLDRDLITLAQPRPGIARVRNEYIDTPLRPPAPTSVAAKLPVKPSAATAHLSSVRRPRTCLPGGGTGVGNPALILNSHHHSQQQHPSSRLVALHPTGFLTGNVNHHHQGTLGIASNTHHHHRGGHHHHQQLPILTQPCTTTPTASFKSGTLKKEKASSDEHGNGVGAPSGGGIAALTGGAGSELDGDSIICSQCRKCKCDACRSPRPLPSSWICGKKYQCSADTTLDYCSCMCCVKGVFYHCAKDYEDDCDGGEELACADRPCSCAPHRRWARWGCLSALTLALPCLLCYWPMRGCLHVCQMCYTRYHSHGCRCVVDRRKGGGHHLSTSSSSSSTASSHLPSSAATTPGSDSAATPTKRLLDSPLSGIGAEC